MVTQSSLVIWLDFEEVFVRLAEIMLPLYSWNGWEVLWLLPRPVLGASRNFPGFPISVQVSVLSLPVAAAWLPLPSLCPFCVFPQHPLFPRTWLSSKEDPNVRTENNVDQRGGWQTGGDTDCPVIYLQGSLCHTVSRKFLPVSHRHRSPRTLSLYQEELLRKGQKFLFGSTPGPRIMRRDNLSNSAVEGRQIMRSLNFELLQ